MTDIGWTILACYAATGLFVWLAGDGHIDAAEQHPARTAVEVVAVLCGWPVIAWRAIRSWRGR